MTTKLTLTLQTETIRKAKKYAASKDRSLSQIVENYLRQITEEEISAMAEEYTPRIKRLKGILKTDNPIDYKKIIEEERVKKHG